MTNEQRAENLAVYPDLLELHRRGLEHYDHAEKPTQGNLARIWLEEYDDTEALWLPDDMLGIMRKPHISEEYWALLSIDLDEVVRASAKAVLLAGGVTLDHTSEGYDEALFLPRGTITHVLGALMHEDEVGPVDEIEKIANVIRRQKKEGAYIIANTSTHPRCERPTIRFMQKYLSECFDGIVFPRNFDGLSPHNKGMMKEAVHTELEAIERPTNSRITHMQHIDDSLHHLVDTRSAAEKLGIEDYFDITPRYFWNSQPDEGFTVNHTDTQLEAFVLSKEVFDNAKKGA